MNTQQKNLLQNQAVKEALEQNWEKAVELNKEILAIQPEDIPTLNRLGFALTRLGEVEEAKKTFETVLKYDRYNPIAKKNIQKLTSLKPGSKISNGVKPQQLRTSFIEEPGKTKTATLVRTAAMDVLIHITTGMSVKLVAKKRRVSVETHEGQYIGCIPDDIGLRLEKLLKVGYRYETNIKSAEDKYVSVFIREVERSTAAKNIPSFPGKNGLVMQTEKIINDSLNSIPVDTTPTGEESAPEA